MSDFDDDLGDFLDDDDFIKPIDADPDYLNDPPKTEQEGRKNLPRPDEITPVAAPLTNEPATQENSENRQDESAAAPSVPEQPPAAAPPTDNNEAGDAGNAPEPPPLPEGNDQENAPEATTEKPFLSDDDTDMPDINYIEKGSYFDLTEKTPYLKKIAIGAGWKQRSYEGERLDLDLSLFLLNKDEKTREDGDFIFYNNDTGCDGAIKYAGDNKIGAGFGDDESISIDLNGVPFDVSQIMIIVSIYDSEGKGHHFGMMRSLYVRIVNKDDDEEMIRFKVPEESMKEGTAMYCATLMREGPKWVFEPKAKITDGGLAKIASEYDIIVKELQSTAQTT